MSLASFYAECIDLICSCMASDPEKRISLEKILRHEWFEALIVKVKKQNQRK